MSTTNPNTSKHRRSIRLKGYDYTQPGGYFVTICTHDHECIFGEVVDGEMRLDEYGHIVAEEWLRTEDIRPGVIIDSFVIMPNHTHAIIVITDAPSDAATPAVRATRRVAPTISAPTSLSHPIGPTSGSLGAIVGQIKSVCTKRINRLRGSPGTPVWHRNYHEHIIRDKEDLATIRRYVYENPIRWEVDCYYHGVPGL